MKYKITDIDNNLKIGQVLIIDGKEYVYIDFKKSKAIISLRNKDKRQSFDGFVDEVTLEIDQDWVNKLEEEVITEFIQYSKVRKMKPGQLFIGQDNKEYVFVKKYSVSFLCSSLEDPQKTYKKKFAFVDTVLEKTIELQP